MSANTSISEGGKLRPFGPVVAIMVQGEDGKYYPWFPESDRALATLSVDKNGIYRASDKGVYGWSSVSVNVPTSEGVTGKDPDTGEDVYVHPDPETGELVTDVLPVEIRVITPPTNPYGTYVDGQSISTDGMVVKAYLASGGEYGTVSNGEITLNPTTAAYDASTDYRTADGDLETGLEMPFPFSSNLIRIEERATGKYIDTTNCVAVTSYGSNFFVCASNSPGQANFATRIEYKDGREPYESTSYHALDSSFTHDGKTVYYYANYNGTWTSQVPHANATGAINVGNIAWTMVYGNTTGLGSHQTINVSWPRPGDGAVLETTFDILVGPHGGTGDD